MKIRVPCFTGMRQHAPEGASDFEIDLEAGTRVGALLNQMGIPADARPFIAVNGLRAERDKRLGDGATSCFSQRQKAGDQ